PGPSSNTGAALGTELLLVNRIWGERGKGLEGDCDESRKKRRAGNNTQRFIHCGQSFSGAVCRSGMWASALTLQFILDMRNAPQAVREPVPAGSSAHLG